MSGSVFPACAYASVDHTAVSEHLIADGPTTNLFKCLEGLLLQHEFLKVLFVKLISLRGEQQFRLVIARSKNSIQSSQLL